MGQWRFVMVGFNPMTFLWLRVWLQVGNRMNICWNQVSLYKGGEQTGPAKFTWPNGAVREGSKVGFLSWTFIAYQHTCQSSKSFKLLVPAIVKSVASSGERSLGRWMLLHLQWGTKGWKTRRWEVRIQFQLFDLGKILVFENPQVEGWRVGFKCETSWWRKAVCSPGISANREKTYCHCVFRTGKTLNNWKNSLKIQQQEYDMNLAYIL